MEKLSIGDVIARERKKQGMSQRALSEGICAVSTLSRLETGQQTPSLYIIQGLCQKLKLPIDDLPVILGPRDLQVEALRREIISLNACYEEATEAEQSGIREQCYAKIHAMEEFLTKDDRIPRQLLLRSQAILGKEDGTPYSPEEEIALLLEALRLTAPGIDLEHLDGWHLTLDEVKLINQIALCFSRRRKRDEALALYSRLFTYLQSRQKSGAEVARQICLVASNYAGVLRLNEQFREGMKIAKFGREACQKYGHYEFLGALTHTLAECYHFLGEDEESISLFFQAYNFYQFTGNKKGVTLLKADARDYFPELAALTISINRLFG